MRVGQGRREKRNGSSISQVHHRMLEKNQRKYGRLPIGSHAPNACAEITAREVHALRAKFVRCVSCNQKRGHHRLIAYNEVRSLTALKKECNIYE